MMATVDISRAKAIPSPFMSDAELTWLAEQACAASTIVEIGCAWGRSTRALADHCDGVVYAVDRWFPKNGIDRRLGFLEHLADHITSGRVVPLHMTSQEGAAHLADLQADVIFIDASHAYENVRADIAAWRPCVRPGGLLCGHDYWPEAQPGVRQAVDEAFAGLFTRHADSIWAVRV